MDTSVVNVCPHVPEGPFARRSLGPPSPIELFASARLELEIGNEIAGF
jgi:hypothetical protein